MTPQPIPTLAQLREQLQQLQALHTDGALTAEQFEPASQRLERMIVDRVLSGEGSEAAATEAITHSPYPGPHQVPRVSTRLWLAGGAVVMAIAAGGYAWTGSPALWNSRADAPKPESGATDASASGSSHTMDSTQIEAMIERLKSRLKTQANDAQGWAMLARSTMAVGRTADALTAYQKAVALAPDDAPLLADYADALALRNGKRIEGEPLKWVEKALKLDPQQTKALSLAGTAAFDREDFGAAVQHWEKLLSVPSLEATLGDQVRESIAEARRLGGMPGSGDRKAPEASGATVSGTVTLSPSLNGQSSPEDTVFVFARAAQGSRMPLAILRKQVKDLPLNFALDANTAMTSQAQLKAGMQVVVGARISKSGNATPAPGDLQGISEVVPVGSKGLQIEIRQVLDQRAP